MENITVFNGEATLLEVTGKLVIKKFVKVMKVIRPGESFESEPFMVAGTPMTIEVFPNGKCEQAQGQVSIYLDNKSSVNIRLLCELVTDVNTVRVDHSHLVPAWSGLGFSWATHARCAAAYEEKDFVVTANIDIPGQKMKIHRKQKFNVLENVYKRMQRPDFKLVCDGAEVGCHKDNSLLYCPKCVFLHFAV